ncbi:acyltransferase [Methanothrix sp.]|uniref:acyltransferase n=2 Tax=Methanothrix sp. TaxID=90426 RepID=UPI00316AC3BB
MAVKLEKDFINMGDLMLSSRDKIAFNEAAQFNENINIIFAIKFFKNWILERLASAFPIPSWRVKLHRMRGINIGKNVYVGYDVIFDRIHPDCISIGDYAEIGDRCIISAHSRGTLPLRDKYPRTVKPVRIGQGVWIAPGCIIIQGVEIGNNSVIGTGSFVNRSIPANSVAVGVPARVIKKLDEMEDLTNSG